MKFLTGKHTVEHTVEQLLLEPSNVEEQQEVAAHFVAGPDEKRSFRMERVPKMTEHRSPLKATLQDFKRKRVIKEFDI